MMEDQNISMPFAKAISSLAAAASAIGAKVAQLSYAEIAALLAACYTSLLILDWFWVRLWRPMLERRGWLKRKHLKVTHYVVETDHSPLGGP